jgi:hypothetical protein
MTQHELESLLYEIDYHGYITMPLSKLYRLLGKKNRAAGTWQALLDSWESIEGDPVELYIIEFPNGNVFISKKATNPVTVWAGHD